MKIEINFRIIFFIILMCILNKFNIYFIFMVSIFLHEIFHFIVGICMGLEFEKVRITSLGVSLELMSYKEKNKSMKKIVIYASGPIFNFILALIFYLIDIDYNLKINMVYTNLCLGVFNLLPIMPLDGGKIFKELFLIKYDYKKSSIYSLNISRLILIFISILYSFLIFEIKNVFIFFTIVYLWYLFFIEERKLQTVLKAYNVLEKSI